MLDCNVIFCLVTSYCAKFPSSGVGAPVVVCRRREIWSADEVEFLCKLYLPRNSPIYQPIKVCVIDLRILWAVKGLAAIC